VNFVAHVVVAARAEGVASTAFLLGAAAPDLVRMAGLPMVAEGPPGFLAGVSAHRRTDAAFHESDWFRTHNRALVADLGARGLRRGQARGAAHVLIELLLDGVVLADDAHAATFAVAWDALGRVDDDALSMVSPEHHQHWTAFLGQLTTRLDPAAYADPSYAADRTSGTLSRRPRLALDDTEQAVLRSVSVDVRTSVATGADQVLASVAGALG
jgi:acyl carrier protein phosphodiesterase